MMRKLLILMGILFISGGVVGLEYWRFPNRATSLQSSLSGGKGLFDRNSVEMTIPLSQISEKNFELAGISAHIEKKTRPVEHLFGIIRINDEDRLLVLKDDFFEAGSEKALVSIYEVFPLADTTVSKLFLLLRQKLEAPFVGDLESGVNQSDEFGIHSLYFNSRTEPDRTFLLGVTSGRILGFEYLKENHERLLPLIRQLLPSPSSEKTGAG